MQMTARRMTSHRIALLGTAAVVSSALAMPGAARAEEEDAEDAPITVTALKRETTLQAAPVAVSVTSAETIEQAQIRDLKDLSSVVPSLRVNTLQSSANTNFVIRGFGNGANNAGIEPSVGLFVDGVYRSRSAAMITDLPDVERIEVLRGPQSTLFGKNASAGIISIATKKPQFELGGNLEASYGNFNAVVLKGVVTGPLSETVAASIAGTFNSRDGTVRDLGTGRRTDERNRFSVRGQLLWEAAENTSFRLIGDYGKIDEECCSVVNLRPSAATGAITAPQPFGLGGRVNDFRTPFADVTFNNFASTNEIENWGLSGEINHEMGEATLTSITSYRVVSAITNQDSDFTSGQLLSRNFQDVDIKTFTQEMRLNAGIGEQVKLLAGAYYFSERIGQTNQVLLGSQFRPYADLLIRGQSNNAFNLGLVEGLLAQLSSNPALLGSFFRNGNGTNEAYRLKNDAFSFFTQVDFEITDRLTLTAGINYTHDSKRFATNVNNTDVFASLPLANFVAPATNVFIAQTIGGILGPVAAPTGFASQAQILAFAGANPANFAAIQTGAATSATSLLALRALQLFPPFLNVPNAVESGRIKDNDPSFTVSLAYQVTDEINTYLRYATGYKAASVNLSRDSKPSPADFATIQARGLSLANLRSGGRFAEAEDATLYEAGIKGDWGNVSVNLAVFKQEIKNFQSNIFTGVGFFLANAGKQSTFGVEFEGMWKPVDPLTLTLAMTYLDPTYDQFNISAFGDLSGTKPAGFTPFSLTVGGNYVHELGNGDRIIFRSDFHYEAPFRLVEGLPNLIVTNPITNQVLSVTAALAAATEFKQDVKELNASITYAMESGLELTVWARNLTDDRMIRQIFDSPAQLGSISGYPNQPRTYGFSARFRF